MRPARLGRRIAYWWRFRAEQDELRQELELHRAMVAEELERRGVAADAARDQARRTMGNETFMREEARGAWLSPALESIANDVSYAWRGLRRSPGFTALVVLIMALTIAANTIVFSVVHHVLLDPLPYQGGNRIVRLGTESARDPLALGFGISTAIYRQAIARSRTLDEFAAASVDPLHDPSDPDKPPVTVAAITRHSCRCSASVR